MRLMKKFLFLASLLGAYVMDNLIFVLLLHIIRQLGVAGYIIVLLARFAYRVLTTGLFGSTIGMRILRLRLNVYSLRICLKREIYRAGSSLFFLGYLLAIADPYGRTLHDMAAGTVVVYGKNRDMSSPNTVIWYRLAALVMVLVEIPVWGIKFVMNDMGLVGLNKTAVSGECYQSFEGDNLISLSQNELYLKSIGRKYTTPAEYDDGVHLVRISNKGDYTELYRLDVNEKEITGSYLGNTEMTLQFICSGRFRSTLELSGLSSSGMVYFMERNGRSYGKRKVSINDPVTLSCGDVDGDGMDEAAVMGRNGELAIFKYDKGQVLSLYSGKIGEDILAETFYISDGLVISGEEKNRRVLYNYSYSDGSLIYKSRTVLNTDGSGRISAFGDSGMAIVSYIYRNNMTFNVGRIQCLEVYKADGKSRRVYNFGNRKGRRYDYRVRSLENIVDLDGDGKKEVVLKSMEKGEVEGERYRIEIYKLSPLGLGINRVITFLEGLLARKF